MNERIKELAKQAEGWANQFEEHWGDGPDTNELFKQKFAELIVKECMEQVWYSREDGINGNVSEVIKERIKQHFGVEE